MIGWVEKAVAEEAAVMELGDRFPRPSDTREFIQRFEAWFEKDYGPSGIPSCFHRLGKPALIVIPQHFTGFEHDKALCEETGHARYTMGMGQILEYLAPNDPGARKLARICKAHDELIARSFLMAWFLPARLVRLRSEWEVIDLTGFPTELVRERYRDVREWDRCQAVAARLDAYFRAEFAQERYAR